MIVDSPQGLFCPGGAFHLDPLGAVQRAVITHAHGDHARAGNAAILCTPQTAALVKRRVGEGTIIEILEYGARRRIGEVTVSLHPAGHMLGSAQVRIEGPAGVWVLSGDYKREPDPTCAPFEPLRCDVFVTEASYALPIFRWDSAANVAAEIASWWQGNARKASLLFCYALGKAQRLLAELARVTERPVFVHGAVEPFAEIYRAAGVRMLPTRLIGEERSFAGELVLAPITARGSTWMRRFGDAESAFASGSMRIRGQRRRRSFDRGFALSDHVDWPGLLRTIEESGARRVLATHGYREALVRFLTDRGTEAAAVGLAHPTDPEGD